MKTIGIQGIVGSYHHIVAKHFFDNNVVINECLSFDALVDSLVQNASDQIVMAIENTIAGAILPNYSLIDKYNLQIIGEYFLPINHHLMALPNQTILDIKEVYSHPMALLQCKAFFKRYKHIKLIEDVATAAAAKRIYMNQLRGVATIAPKIATDIFKLEVLEKEIQTIKNNETRFVILQKSNSKNKTDSINKATFTFELDHKRGSLAAILNIMNACKLNLTKIQSLPKIQNPWTYMFFADVTFDAYQDFEKAKIIIELMASNVKLLGTYKNGSL